MPALGFHRPEKDVAVAASDDREIGSRFEFVTGSDPLRDDDLAFDRESRCHEVGFSYRRSASMRSRSDTANSNFLSVLQCLYIFLTTFSSSPGTIVS